MEFLINLKLVYHHAEVHSEFVNKAIKAVNDAYYSSELEDLDKIKDQMLRTIDKSSPFAKVRQTIELDKAFNEISTQIKKYRDASVIIKEAKEGSLEITIIGTGLGIWLLQQTFGQTIKEAWLKTNIHKDIVGLLTKKIFFEKKARHICQSAEEKLKRIPNSEIKVNHIEFLESEKPGMIIDIYIGLMPEEEYPPSFDAALNNFKKIRPKSLKLE